MYLSKSNRSFLFFLIFIFIFLMANNSVLFAESNRNWILQNRYPTTETLRSVFFIDSNHGWVCGGSDVILMTSDGGRSWSVQKPEIPNFPESIFFVDKYNGFAAGRDGVILYTEDSGLKWNKQLLCKGCSLKKIIFSDRKEGFIVSDSSHKNAGPSISLYKTENGGKQWKKILSKPFEYNDMRIYQKSIFLLIFDQNTKRNIVLRTDDSGKKWKKQIIPGKGRYRSIEILKSGKIVCCGDEGRIAYTESGANSWKVLYNDRDDFYHYVKSIDGRTVIVMGNNRKTGSLLLKFNENLKKMKNIDTATTVLFDMCSSGSGTGYTVGAGGQILKTVDGGSSWNSVSQGISSSIRDIFFADKNTGWAICGFTGGWIKENICVLKTTNGGKTWRKVFSGGRGSLHKMSFSGSKKGFISGRGFNLITDNAGENWKKIISEKDLTGFYFFDKTNGVAINFSNLFFTNDEGRSWHRKNTVLPLNFSTLRNIYFLKNKGFLIGDGGLLKTEDRGNIWKRTSADIKDSFLNRIFFINNSIGWAAGRTKCAKPLIMKTQDGGNTWENCSSSALAISGDLNDIFFPNETIGFAVGTSGIILKTTDGGKTWKQQSSGTANNLNKIFFIDDKTGWIVGDFGTILFTNTGGE